VTSAGLTLLLIHFYCLATSCYQTMINTNFQKNLEIAFHYIVLLDLLASYSAVLSEHS